GPPSPPAALPRLPRPGPTADGRRPPSDGGRGRPRHAPRRRQCGGCRHRHPGDADAGRAAGVGPRRRRADAPLGCRHAPPCRLGRPRDRPRRRIAHPLPPRRPAHGLLRGRGRRARRRRARRPPHARGRPQAPGQAALGPAPRPRHRRRRGRLHHHAPPRRPDRRRCRAPAPRPAGPRLFPAQRQAPRRGRPPAQPRAGRHPPRHRRTGRGCPAPRPHRRRDRRRRPRPCQSRPAHHRRPRRLRPVGAPARLRPLSRQHRLLHAAAELGRCRGPADPRPARPPGPAARPAQPRCRAPPRRGRPHRLRRPQPLPRRCRPRPGARPRPARPDLPRHPRPAHRPRASACHPAPRQPALAGRRAPRLPAAAAGAWHQPHLHRRCRRQCRLAHHHHRGCLRRPGDGPWLPAQQRAHRLLLPARDRRPPRRQPRRPGQAPPLLHGAEHRLRRRWPAHRHRRLGRRLPHHRPCRPDAGGDAGLGDGAPGRRLPPPHRRAERDGRAGSRHQCRRPRPGARGPRLPGRCAGDELRPHRHPHPARGGWRPPAGRRRPQAGRRRRRRL
ncbi:MAG: Gamma-glutamyltranspeptidase @ Glutathione hydrolase, partial [uncultured Craurococcus sp.]